MEYKGWEIWQNREGERSDFCTKGTQHHGIVIKVDLRYYVNLFSL
jgi:hypothetical protein